MEQDMQRIAVSRPAGNNTFVSSYIAAELRKCGLPVFKQRFPQGMNIVATQKGTTTNTIIVGSHYDSMPRTPGADDNGSGVVVNLAVARNLSKRKFTNTITYIFFDAEEGGLIGSAYYANNMKEKCIFMVNLDMVGHLKLTTVATTSGVPDALFKKYPWAKAVSFQTMGSPSDQTSFQRLGIPALWVFTGTHSHYHQPSDTPATLNFNGMRLIKNYVEDVVLSFDKKVDTQFIQSLNVSNDTL
jgi:Zn-dependent M28 family amino/carboxypeptidase